MGQAGGNGSGQQGRAILSLFLQVFHDRGYPLSGQRRKGKFRYFGSNRRWIGLDTKLPAKRFGEAVPEFRLVPNKPVLEGKFVPIKPEEPFAYIERLKDAYLTQREEQLGIIVKEAGT